VTATGLALPTGKLYVSNFGLGFGPGAGQIVRITRPDSAGTHRRS